MSSVVAIIFLSLFRVNPLLSWYNYGDFRCCSLKLENGWAFIFFSFSFSPLNVCYINVLNKFIIKTHMARISLNHEFGYFISSSYLSFFNDFLFDKITGV